MKVSLRNTGHDNSPAVETETPPKHYSTKLAYSKLLEEKYLSPTAEPNILNHGFTKEDIQNVYMLPFRILKHAKLIMFQIKIIHNILPTQSSLFRAGLADHDKCPFCNLERQTLTHMLCTCCQSLAFWNQFTYWWQTAFRQHINLSEYYLIRMVPRPCVKVLDSP